MKTNISVFLPLPYTHKLSEKLERVICIVNYINDETAVGTKPLVGSLRSKM